MPKLLPATLGLVVVSALAATGINHYQSATANGIYQIAAAPGAGKAKKATPASGKCNPRAGTGTLVVNIENRDGATPLAVTVIGPNRFSRRVTSSQTFRNVRTGTYRATLEGGGGRIFESRDLVDDAFSPGVTPNPGCVQRGETATMSVSYALEPGSGKMWVSAELGTPYPFYSLNRNSLQESGSPNPATTFTNMWSNQRNAAMDKQGNLWVVVGWRIERYPRATLGFSRRANPDIILSGTWIESGDHLAFDSAGGLWFSNLGKGKVVRFSPNQLTRSGEPVPEIVIGDFVRPRGIAFDRAGNLWIIEDTDSEHHTIHRYNAARLTRSTNEPGDIRMTVGALVGSPETPTFTQFSNPRGLAFDRAGNLWVAFWNEHRIAKITPSEQERGGNIAPTISFLCCRGVTANNIAFDNEENLWITGNSSGDMVRFNHNQLETENPEPNIRINPTTAVDDYLGGIIFNPSPSWSPINDR